MTAVHFSELGAMPKKVNYQILVLQEIVYLIWRHFNMNNFIHETRRTKWKFVVDKLYDPVDA